MHLFECIGIPFVNETVTGQRFRQLAEAGTSRVRHRKGGGELIMWTDEASGAVMTFNTNRHGEIVCAQPGFHAGFDFKGVSTGFGRAPDKCTFCDPLLATQPFGTPEVSPPFVFHLANAGHVRKQLKRNAPVDLIVVGFAESIQFWADEASFRGEPGNEESELEMSGFLYDPKHPSPSQYLLTGRVLTADLRTNSATSMDFWTLVISAPFVDGQGWQLVARCEDLPSVIERGNVVRANVWASAVAITE